MKLTLRIGAAIGIVALAACSQSGQDNAANMESDTQMSTNETVLPADEGGRKAIRSATSLISSTRAARTPPTLLKIRQIPIDLENRRSSTH
ncbi:hypothetical protein H9L14_12570 [Sphingomonas sediminicola]|uniref:Lipoprotein n=1 Tax=Sphingomonas sediminicola TaxID=386874 RepID=A0ABX6T6A8_9SPHN|nr:hypothetical protein [Sphingomonas sediminicola]QNP45411.1 hypothetical protein H9L14_12570 [Sphingomonas sediminicola]